VLEEIGMEIGGMEHIETAGSQQLEGAVDVHALGSAQGEKALVKVVQMALGGEMAGADESAARQAHGLHGHKA